MFGRIVSVRLASTVTTSAKSEATRKLLDKILRVDHAGEHGAVRIYEGQLCVLSRTKVAGELKEMKEQELVHRTTFEKLIPQHRARPTLLLPLWDFAGFALGAGTALLGKEAAMACTVAVETAIGEHYDSQIRALMSDGEDGIEKHKELIETISKFRDEELHHLDVGLQNDAELAPFYKAMSQTIQMGCKAAIWLSERI